MENIHERIINEVEKVIVGKREVIEKIMMAIMADGHVLLDDVPGTGKTTMAVSLSCALGVKYHRIQFTPDVLPSDIVGFSIYDKETGGFTYMPGIVTDTNLLLADEINRTSSRTQAALLEAMEENQVTVDGKVHPLEKPFTVIATQNQVGTAGTQLLPQAQLDRFIVKLSIGYPDKDSQKEIIKERQDVNLLDRIQQVSDCESVKKLQADTLAICMKDEIISYITDLVFESQNTELLELGISPRGAVAVSHMSKARAVLNGRDYVVPEDVRDVFKDVCAHRIILTQKARAEHMTPEDVLDEMIKKVKVPFSV